MADETRVAPNLSLSTLLAIWSRRKWIAVLSFLTVFSVGAAVTVALPQIYQSAATILVVGQQVPIDYVRSTVTGSLDSRLQTISQEILSRSRLEALIDKFGLYSALRSEVSLEALSERMRRDIEVKTTAVDRSGATVAFAIKYQGRDPDTVAQVTTTLASYYIDENMKVRERQATGTADFLRVQLNEVKTRLEGQERHVSDFRRKNYGELPSQLDSNLSALERLNGQFRLNGEKQIRTREQKQEMARLIESMATVKETPVRQTTRPRPAAAAAPSDPASARLARMKQELAELRTRFSDRYPDVMQLRADIEALERQIAESRRDAPRIESVEVKEEPRVAGPDLQTVQMEQALAQLDLELKGLKEEEAELRAAMARYQARVDNTPKRDIEFQELSRDYDSTRDLYRTLLKRYEEAQLSENLEQRQKGEQFRILDTGMPGVTPAAPNRMRLLLMSLVLSLGVAAGLVILAEQLDGSVHTADELRAMSNVPVIVSIPRIVTAADTRRRRWRGRFAAVGAVCGLVVIVGATYYAALGNEQLLRMVSPGRF